MTMISLGELNNWSTNRAVSNSIPYLRRADRRAGERRAPRKVPSRRQLSTAVVPDFTHEQPQQGDQGNRPHKHHDVRRTVSAACAVSENFFKNMHRLQSSSREIAVSAPVHH